MRRAREILRFYRDAGLSTREVTLRAGVTPSTMREMMRRLERSGLGWPLPPEMTDAVLEARLYGPQGTKPATGGCPSPTGRRFTGNSSASM